MNNHTVTNNNKNMKSDVPRIKVAFLFFSTGKDWHGGKNYFRALFDALDKDPDCTLHVHAFFGKKINPAEFQFPTSVTCITSGILDRGSFAWFFDRVFKRLFGLTPLMKRVLKSHGIKIVSHCDPLDSGGLPNIAWIPDFQHVHLPHFFKPKELATRNAQFKSAIKNSQLVVVSSHAALADLRNFLPTQANKARVLRFCAIQPEVKGNGTFDVLQHYSLDNKFFYIPNQFWAHKNHRIAIEALALLHENWPDLKIVCSGALSDYRNPEHIDSIRAKISDLDLNEHFVLLGLIPYEHISQLMVHATAVINPSYFEGWSTTVEEAKALGVPLLLSDIPVHREQCPNDEALFFHPDDCDSLISHIKSILKDECPLVNKNNLVAEKALEKHRLNSRKFAQTYVSIVQEAASYDANQHIKP